MFSHSETFEVRCSQSELVMIQRLKVPIRVQPSAAQLPVTPGKEDFLVRHMVRKEWAARDSGIRREEGRSNQTPSMLQVRGDIQNRRAQVPTNLN